MSRLFAFHFELRIEDSPNPHLIGSQYLTDYYDNHVDYNIVLRRQLRGWMGPNFVYNPYVGRFTTYKRLSEIHNLVREEVRREQSLVQRLARWAKNDRKKLFRGRERILHERRVEAVEETLNDWRAGRHLTSDRMYRSALRLGDRVPERLELLGEIR
jgi:hypothetical protein